MALAATALAALALAGCGGHTATRHDVVTRANAVCVDTLSRLRAVPPPTSASAAALTDYLRRAQPIVAAESRSIAALPRPRERRATLDAFVAQVRAVARGFVAARTAAAGGDAAGARAALSALGSNRAAELARGYGIAQCTGAVATLGR